MDLCLIADLSSALATLWVVLQVAAGLGMVIFVHELGHFLVAKACGVQCDKFYIGFDPPLSLPLVGKLINGLGSLLGMVGLKVPRVPDPIRLPSALFKKKWGETEYGIGIIPLGGYVKMLGQDDNPANAAEEMRRARIYKEQQAGRANGGQPEDEPATPAEAVSATTTLGDVPEEPHAHEPGEPVYELNPRSYLAKNVPQRMAIISAGVVMNVIFAFVFATWAYSLGVKYTPTIVSHVVPGSPAWEAGLPVGAEIVKIGDKDKLQFRDLQQEVTLGDLKNGVTLTLAVPGEQGERQMTLVPSTQNTLPQIGIRPSESLTLSELRPVDPANPAAEKFQPLDEIVAVDGQEIRSFGELRAILAMKADDPLQVTVLRGGEVGESNAPGERVGGERITIDVPPVPMRRLGLEMRIGQISGIQKGSPAEKAGLQVGDHIERINGELVGDPVTLPDRLRDLAVDQLPAVLDVRRNSETVTITAPLRVPDWYDTPLPGTPMSAPALGIAYQVLNTPLRVEPNSPAAKAQPANDTAKEAGPGILAQDIMLRAEFVPAEGDTSEVSQLLAKRTVKLDGESNWPGFITQLQSLPLGMSVKLTVKRNDKELQYLLQPEAAAQWFNPERGFNFETLEYIRRAETLGEAATLGFRETRYAMGAVYRFLRKLGSQVPITALGGPLTIAKGAGYSAFHGFSTLLIFLTLLSANLAVVNFLPIPLLDGGHMVLLTLEGIMRRPVSEKVVAAFQMIGFVFILSLMMLVITLDIGREAGFFRL